MRNARVLRNNFCSLVVLTALYVAAVAPASGALIIDPEGDFLPSYTGPQTGDLDILQAETFFDGSSFLFTSTSADAIGTTPTGVFVWGINRGSGTELLPAIAPGVTFDAVVIIVPGGGSFVQALDTMVVTPIPALDVLISGAFLSARVPLAALPSTGFAAADYTVNIWPRSELLLIDPVASDFAPDNENAAVTVVPEPATALTLGLALTAIGLLRRKVRK
jgi:hypothetical protein